jgi:nucleoside-diphosphate-sugar epimerase
MKHALVTGGCGFVGRHVVSRLLRLGRPVWIVDDLSTGKHPDEWLPTAHEALVINERVIKYRASPSVTFVNADVRIFLRDYFHSDRSALFNYVAHPPEFGDVFHFAAVVGGRAKIEGEPMAVAIDLSIDAEFFNWAVKARPGRILYASSSAVYPVDLQRAENAVALKEDFVQFDDRLGQPDMTYGWSKLTGEYLARIASKHYGLHVATVRPFSGYGEDQDETYPIPAIAARVARREDPLIIWGSGEQGRDFVHIEDCVDAMWLALDKISDGSAVNIGSGQLLTFYEVARIFAQIAGYNPRIKPLEDKPVGVHSRYANVELSEQLLGWKPKISVIEGFSRVYEAALAKLHNTTQAI